MRWYQILFLFLLFSCETNDTIKIGEYLFQTPDWWDDIEVSIPESIKTKDEVSKYITIKYGGEVGTIQTWKYALKSWVIFEEKTKGFPVFIGHCFSKGEDHSSAAKVYSDLYFLANTQKEDEYWYKCYLAFNAGEEYTKLKDFEKAITWYSYSNEVRHKKPDDSAIMYYAQ